MEENRDFWNKHKRTIIKFSLIVLFLAFIPIVIVHLLFKWNSGIDFFSAKWGAGDVLSYIGTILTFAGTIVLSFFALQASHKANALSQRVIDIEQSRYTLQLRPFVMVSNWTAFELTPKQIVDNPTQKYISIGGYHPGNSIGLALELMNTTESCITVAYKQGIARTPDKNWSNAAVNQCNLKMTLKPGDKDSFVFYGSPEYMHQLVGERITVELILENRCAQRYKESFVIILSSLFDKVYLTPGKLYCHLFVQEYKIGRFEKKHDGSTDYIEECL